MNYLQGERILILGLGISGLAMARWCVRCGAVVRVADTREHPAGLKGLMGLQESVARVEFISGEFNAELLSKGDAVMTRILLSPGLIPHEKGIQVVLAKAKDLSVPVWGELDLFSEALRQIDEDVMAQEEWALMKALEEREFDEPSVIMQLPEDRDDKTGDVGDEFQGGFGEDEDQQPDSRFEDVDLSFDSLFGEYESENSLMNESLPMVIGYKPKIVAITGTNGKTTVTSLTSQVVKRSGKRVVTAGNIGLAMMDALIEAVDENILPEVWVLELSSFQLESSHAFEPTVATILNVSQDHLDWHETMANYIAAKGRIFGEKTARVLNRDDDAVMAFMPVEIEDEEKIAPKRKRVKKQEHVQVVTFGVGEPRIAGDFGLLESNGMTWLCQAETVDQTLASAGAVTLKYLMPLDVLHIRGRHNASNALAALGLASLIGCEFGPMLQALRVYKGEPHRVELIASINGVEYIDDSKGTNVGATVAAIAGLGVDHKINVILGGQGKGQDFSPLAPMVAKYVRTVVLMGVDAGLIETALKDTGVPLLHAKTLPEAVEVCAKHAEKGDVVLLSPSCASLDMFTNYVHRSEVFVEAVKGMEEAQ